MKKLRMIPVVWPDWAKRLFGKKEPVKMLITITARDNRKKEGRKI